jgi:hypothetical protein
VTAVQPGAMLRWLTVILLLVPRSGFASVDPDPPLPTVRPITDPNDPPATLATQGVLGRDTVRRTIQLHTPAVRYCYTQELGKHRGLTTTVAVTFTIAANGRVTSVEDPGPGPLPRCVGQAVRKIVFPELVDVLTDGTSVLSRSSTAVTYRFAFRPAPRGAPADSLRWGGRPSRPPHADDRQRTASAGRADDANKEKPEPPEATGPKMPDPTPSPAAVPASAPARSKATRGSKVRARGRGKHLDTRHGDDPLKGIPAGDAL